MSAFATATKADTKRADRGHLLIIGSPDDHTAPIAMAKASFRKQRRNTDNLTEFAELPGRGHSLIVDSGWRDVADLALEFFGRTAPATS